MSNDTRQRTFANPLEFLESRSRQANKSAPASRSVSPNEESNLRARLNRLAAGKPPPPPRSLSMEEIKSAITPLLKNGTMRIVNAVPRDVLDKRMVAKKEAYKQFTTSILVFNYIKKDGEVFAAFKNHLIAISNDKALTVQEYELALQQTMGVFGSGGSMSGLLTRLVEGISEVPRPKIPANFEDRAVEWAQSVLDYVPFEGTYVGKDLIDCYRDPLTQADINLESDAGIPYFAAIRDRDGEVLETGFYIGGDIVARIANGSLGEMLRKRPALQLVKLKNKTDFYSQEDVERKVRPYYVFPLHERLLYSAVQHALVPRLFHVTGSTYSGSAIGFTFTYGGGDLLMDFISSKRTDLGFYPIFYGDDQLWIFATPVGVYVAAPDFRHMDMSLMPEWGTVAFRIWSKHLGSALDKTWAGILKLNTLRAFDCHVIIDGPLVVRSTYGLKSGIPGTSKFDEVASATINGFIKGKYDTQVAEASTEEEVGAIMKKIVAEVPLKFGLLVKQGTDTLYKHVSDVDKTEWQFLGYRLVKVKGRQKYHYVPLPELSRLLLTATTYRRRYTSNHDYRCATVTKLRSLVAQGGYLYPDFYDMAYEWFRLKSSEGIKPFKEDDDRDTDEIVFIPDIRFPEEDFFPSRNWCLNLYLPRDDRVDENTVLTADLTENPEMTEGGYDFDSFTDALQEFVTQPRKSEDSGETVFHDAPEAPIATVVDKMSKLNWADDVGRDMFADKGDIQMPGISSSANPDKAHLVQPLSQATKVAFEKAQAEVRDRANAAKSLARGLLAPKKRVKGKRTKFDHKGKRSGAAHADDYDAEYNDMLDSAASGWSDTE